MKKYIDYAADIYGIYLRYISRDDIHMYSKEKQTMERRELSEDAADELNRILNELHIERVVRCVYYSPLERIEKIVKGEAVLFENRGYLQVDNIQIPLSDIVELSF